MNTLPDISGAEYHTSSKLHDWAVGRRVFKGAFWFYLRYAWIVIWAGTKFSFTRDPQKAVTLQSRRVLRLLERQGADMSFEGLDNFPKEEGPYVFACNHMGSLEVNALPGLVASRTPMTFVVKSSLLTFPFMGVVLKRLGALPVERRHPGEDLMQVLNEGKRLLSEGVSVILFPEGTRQDSFDPARFNSLAVKLALAAGVKIVPVALKTDFWGVGKRIREFGSLRTSQPVHISFSQPLKPQGRGKAEHQASIDFISGHLEKWNRNC